MITHAQYMAEGGEKLHHAYHCEMADAAGVTVSGTQAKEARMALDSGDEHLNTIPLHLWDMRAAMYAHSISRACKERGTFYSMATGVCVLKAAAIRAANALKA